MRKWTAGLAGLGLLLLAAVSGQPAQAAEEEPSKIIRVGATQAMDSMNPFLAVRLVSSSIHRWMYGFLTVPDAKTLQPSPDLAESWTTSQIGRAHV